MPTENRGAEMEDTHAKLSDCIFGQRVAISMMEASVSLLQPLRAARGSAEARCRRRIEAPRWREDTHATTSNCIFGQRFAISMIEASVISLQPLNPNKRARA